MESSSLGFPGNLVLLNTRSLLCSASVSHSNAEAWKLSKQYARNLSGSPCYFPSFRSHCYLLSDVSKNGALCILSIVLFSSRR